MMVSTLDIFELASSALASPSTCISHVSSTSCKFYTIKTSFIYQFLQVNLRHWKP